MAKSAESNRHRWDRQTLQVVLAAGLLAIGLIGQPARADSQSGIAAGRRIYVEGLLPSGQPVTGIRFDGSLISGADAACVSCHRHSGMGGIEGTIVVPPITGKFLFSGENAMALLDPRSPRAISRADIPYSMDTLARAVLQGVSRHHQPMNPLMPRYRLDDGALQALAAYLATLSTAYSPGVDDSSVRFATIVTPGVDSERWALTEQMIRTGFQQRNYSQNAHSGQMRTPLELLPHQSRQWTLSVWKLQGEPDSWGAQLQAYYQREPVFAVLSGLSQADWSPIHDFCEQQRLPCLFPHTRLPALTPSRYSLYFNRGLTLEAEVIASDLQGQPHRPPRRILQVHRGDAEGRHAAAALTAMLAGSGVRTEDMILHSGQEQAEWTQRMRALQRGDGIVFWLEPADLSAFMKRNRRPPCKAFISGFLGGENIGKVAAGWGPHLRLVQPYDIKPNRQRRLDSLLPWLESHRLPLVDAVLQTEVFTTLMLLTDVMTLMLDNLYGDYLIERTEDMLARMPNLSPYPHLSLANSQRYASKGAYIGRWDKTGAWLPYSGWTVP